jgi:hypothetical protein
MINKTKSKYNYHKLDLKPKSYGVWDLVFGAYLTFVIWDLEFLL